MKLFRMPRNIRKIKTIGLPIIGFCLGLVVMYLYVQTNLAYQGKTAREWGKLYTDFLSVKCTSDVVKNILSYSPNNTKTISVDEALKCEPGINAYRQYLIDNPIPTPTPEIIYKTNTQYVQTAVSQGQVEYRPCNGGRYLCGSNGSMCQITSSGQIICQ